MNRRRYISVVGTAAGVSVGGCLGADESPARPFGEKQHRNNIAMAPKSVQSVDRVTAGDRVIEPESGRFALVRFWAENLVASDRQLPTIEHMRLLVPSGEAEFEPYSALESWEKQYQGGPVGSGELHAGYVPFEVAGSTLENGVTFIISADVPGFSSAVRWTNE